ncbi:neuromedin-U receptor 2-like [Amphiura filiformis]|uniref:neuromedin-U receptor 2-like n=1 Tax=Amphiura filiformis TaxID=82378 RepID=UPI003B221ABD
MEETICHVGNTLNFTDEGEAMDQLYDKPSSVWVVYIMPIVLSIGIVSNGTFLVVVFRIRCMWTKTNAYLSNLAISDIIFLVFAVLDKIRRHASSPVSYDQSHMGPVGCSLWLLIVDFSYFASLSLVSLVSLEKYYAICTPVEHRLLQNGWKRTIRFITLAWVMSLALAIGLIPAHSVFIILCTFWPDIDKFAHLPSQIAYCGPVSSLAAHIGNGIQTLPFFVGLIFNIFLYCKIIKRLHNRVLCNEHRQNPNMIINNRIYVRNQVAKMLVINGVIFFICLAPFEMLSVCKMISGLTGKHLVSHATFDALLQASRTMSYINAALNPFVYCACNSRYRKAFKSCLTMVKRKIHPVEGDHVDNESQMIQC